MVQDKHYMNGWIHTDYNVWKSKLAKSNCASNHFIIEHSVTQFQKLRKYLTHSIVHTVLSPKDLPWWGAKSCKTALRIIYTNLGFMSSCNQTPLCLLLPAVNINNVHLTPAVSITQNMYLQENKEKNGENGNELPQSTVKQQLSVKLECWHFYIF